jgi:hypothetical protein
MGMNKDELLELLRVCGADPRSIDAVELAYEMGRKAGLEEAQAAKEEPNEDTGG